MTERGERSTRGEPVPGAWTDNPEAPGLHRLVYPDGSHADVRVAITENGHVAYYKPGAFDLHRLDPAARGFRWYRYPPPPEDTGR